MKETDKKKPISTMPNGVWESSDPQKHNTAKKADPSADLQGNGYPDGKQKK